MGQQHTEGVVDSLRRRQVRDLLDQCAVSVGVNAAVAATLVAYFGTVGEPGPVFAWAAAVLAVTAARALACRYARGVLAARAEPPRVRVLTVLAGLSGLIWGVSPWLLLPPASPEALALLVITLAGMVAGAIPVLAARLEVYLAYLICALGPLVLFLLISDQPAALMAGVVVFGVAMAVAAGKYFRRLTENHGLVVQKEELARDLVASRGELEQTLAWLRREAARDGLTGLLNRGAFESALAATPAAGGKAVCYLDLDTFKVVNDTCGHAAGDALLCRIATALRAGLGDEQPLARVGGDEFVALLRDRTPEQARRTAEAMRAAVRELYFVWDERPFRITTSIGLALAGAEPPPGDDLVRAADLACLAAKETGGNRVFVFNPEAEPVYRRQRERCWVERISGALAANGFELHAQPVVSVAGGQSEAAYYELLIRMRDEEGGLIAPGAFLPAAERYALASRVDAWVLSELARCLAADASGARRMVDTCFAVNLSGASLSDSDFIAELRGHLVRGTLPATRLSFEITETAVIHDLPRARQVMEELGQYGCGFALDDFGQGLSSLGYLRSLPVSSLKIDGQFIRGIATDPVDRAMVDAIRRLGHALELTIVAEFVESAEILSVLAQLDVDYAQGYHLGRPIPLRRLLRDIADSSTAAEHTVDLRD